MTISVIAAQAEALGAGNPKGSVSAVTVEVSQTTPVRPVRVDGAQVEYQFVQPNMPCRVDGAQFESLQVEFPGPVRVDGSQIEILYPVNISDTPVAVGSVTIEVLRSIDDKKRRPPRLVVAN